MVPKKPQNLETVRNTDEFKIYCRNFINENFNTISQREIARRLDIGKTTVNKWAKEMGLLFYKNTSDDNYFKKWSNDMAYILGFIAADGNVSWNELKGYYSLTITAAEKDKDHLEKIREFLESTKPLLYGQPTKSYRLIINSKEICRDLIKFGIIPAKSLVLKFPEIPNIYRKDFIRGYIDGDGTLRFFNRPRSPYFELSICSGSLNFIEVLEHIIFLEIGIRSSISKTKNNCYILRYSCARGLKLAEWIYSDSRLFLNRKFIKYQEALSFRKE